MVYNESLKLKYIGSNKSFSDKYKRDMWTIFEKISRCEIKKDIDICNQSPYDYPEILFQSMEFQRFSYFREIFLKLMNYRAFCFESGDIIGTIYFSNLAMHPTDVIGTDELYGFFKTNMEKYNPFGVIYTPDGLYKTLISELYNGCGAITTSVSLHDYVARKTVTLDELTVLYVMLQYFGICSEDCGDIRRKDVTFNAEEGSYTILVHNKIYEITGKTIGLLEKCLNARFIEKRHGFVSKTVQLSYDYLLVLSDDEGSEGRGKRMKKYYSKFAKDSTMVDIRIPTISNIRFYGDIRRMCNFVKSGKVQCDTDDDILELYSAILGKRIKFGKSNGGLGTEIIERFKEFLSNEI